MEKPADMTETVAERGASATASLSREQQLAGAMRELLHVIAHSSNIEEVRRFVGQQFHEAALEAPPALKAPPALEAPPTLEAPPAFETPPAPVFEEPPTYVVQRLLEKAAALAEAEPQDWWDRHQWFQYFLQTGEWAEAEELITTDQEEEALQRAMAAGSASRALEQPAPAVEALVPEPAAALPRITRENAQLYPPPSLKGAERGPGARWRVRTRCTQLAAS